MTPVTSKRRNHELWVSGVLEAVLRLLKLR